MLLRLQEAFRTLEKRIAHPTASKEVNEGLNNPESPLIANSRSPTESPHEREDQPHHEQPPSERFNPIVVPRVRRLNRVRASFLRGQL